MDGTTRSQLDQLMRQFGLYERAREVLRRYAASPNTSASDPFEALQEAGVVDDLLEAMKASGVDAATLSSLAGSVNPLERALPEAPRAIIDAPFSRPPPSTEQQRTDSAVPRQPSGYSLRIRISGGRAFLAHLDAVAAEQEGEDDLGGSAAAAPRRRRAVARRCFVLHLLCCGARVRSGPVPVAVDPAFQDEFVVGLAPALSAGAAAAAAALSGGPAVDPAAPAVHVPPLQALLHCGAQAGGLHVLLSMTTSLEETEEEGDSGKEAPLPDDLQSPPQLYRPSAAASSADEDRRASRRRFLAPPPAVTHELVAAQTLDWRLALAEDAGVLDTMLHLSPAGASAAPAYVSSSSGLPAPVGLLAIQVAVEPSPGASALPKADVRFIIEQQSSREAEKARAFFDYSKQWWTEYKAVHPAFKTRQVKMYAANERHEFHPVCTYVSPLIADRVISSPFHAARFVSLLPFRRHEPLFGGEPARTEVWQSPQAVLALRQGDIEDHATLLCSLLLGFGLDAYVAVGERSDASGAATSGAHTWVVTLDDEPTPPTVSSPSASSLLRKGPRATFWDPLSGSRSDPLDSVSAAGHRIATVHCLFNDASFYACHRLDDRVETATWDLSDLGAWKPLDTRLLSQLPRAQWVPLAAPSIDSTAVAIAIEAALKEHIEHYRRAYLRNVTLPQSDGEAGGGGSGMARALDAAARGTTKHAAPAPLDAAATPWDARLAYLLSQALTTFETERLTGISAGGAEFAAAVRRAVPRGCGFRGFPVQFNHVSPARMMAALLAAPAARDVLHTPADADTALAVRCAVSAYAEDTVAAWVMLVVRHKMTAPS